MPDRNLGSQEIIEIALQLEPKEAIKAFGRFQKAISQDLRDTEKELKQLDRGTYQLVNTFDKVWSKAAGSSKFEKGMRESEKAIYGLERHLEAARGKLEKYRKENAGSKDLKAQLKLQKQSIKYDEKRAALKKMKANYKMQQETSELFDTKELMRDAEELGNAILEPLQVFMTKDVTGIMKKTSGVLAFGLDKTLGALGRRFDPSLKAQRELIKLEKKREKEAKRKAKEERKASALAGGGKTGGVGDIFGKFAGILGKIGPMISIASTFMVGFVKLMIDAESSAKDFNKAILATSGTLDFFNDRAGNTAAGIQDIGDSLLAAMPSEKDFKALTKMGIGNEVVSSYTAALGSAGESFSKLRKDINSSQKSVQSFTDMTVKGVAYSRAFGVSLQEIAQVQGEFLSDVGMGLDGVTASFGAIADGARLSGIAAGKFFGQVRTFSADLSLFSLRIEDVTKVLGLMNKAMDPRNATKALQAIAGKYGGSTGDKLRMTMIAGPDKQRAIQEKSFARQLSRLTEDLQSTLAPLADGKQMGEAIADAITKGNSELLTKLIAKANVQLAKAGAAEIKGGLGESMRDAAYAARRLASGNVVDQASVSDLMDPLAKLESLEEATRRITHQGFAALDKNGILAMEQAGAATEAELRLFLKFYSGIQQGQEELIARLEDGAAVTAEDRAQVAKLFKDMPDMLSKSTKEQAAKLAEMFSKKGGRDKYMASLDKTQREQIEQALKITDREVETAHFQVSTMDQLGVIADILMNRIWKTMLDLWSVTTDIYNALPGVGNAEEKDYMRSQRKLMRSPLESIRNAASGTKNRTELKNNVLNTLGDSLAKTIEAAQAEYREKYTRLHGTDDKGTGAEKDEAKRDALKKRLKELDPLLARFGQKGLLSKEGLARYAKDNKSVMDMLDLITTFADMAKASGVSIIGEKGETAGPTPNTPAAATPVKVIPTPVANDSKAPATAAEQQATTQAADAVNRTLESGVMIDKTSFDGSFEDNMARSVYEGSSRALFEYYMYSSLDRNQVAAAMQTGVRPDWISGAMSTGTAPSTALAALTGAATDASKGKPVVVELKVSQGLRDLIDTRVQNGVVKHETARRNK